MSKISELTDGGSLLPTDFLIAVRSGGNVKVQADDITVDQINLGDNEFIRLGNSQDLTMVHTPTQSIINQAGVGDLLIQKAGATKLTINASGIDVTGTVTASGEVFIAEKLTHTGDTDTHFKFAGANDIRIVSGNVEHAAFDGTIVFNQSGSSSMDFRVESDTQAHMLFVDASLNRIGIANNAPATTLDVTGTVTATSFASTAGGTFTTAAGNDLNIVYPAGRSLFIKEGSDTHVTVDNVGNVGIGTSSPDAKLAIEATSQGNFTEAMRITNAGGGVNEGNYIQFEISNTSGYGPRIGGRREGSGGSGLHFYTGEGNAAPIERLRIDHDGNVGIGVTPSAWSGTTGLQLSTGCSLNGSSVNAALGANSYYDGTNWKYIISSFSTNYYSNYANNGSHVWQIAPSGTAAATITYTNAMTLDASGNLLVGKTSQATATIGAELGSSGYVSGSRDGNTAGFFNRATSDGEVIRITKDGTTVGSIGTNGGDLFVGTGDTNILFVDGSDKIMPVTTGGATRDAAIDLGTTGGRFKDLYLSGIANIGTYLRFGGASNYYVHSDNANYLRFGTAGSERMRIDSSGNVIVGTTNLAPVSNNVQGVSIRSFGELQSSRDGAATLYLNRKTNDGDIVILRKDGADVGSIGTVNGSLYISSPYSTDSGLRFSASIVHPCTTTGAPRDNAIDLGYSAGRFVDIYATNGTIQTSDRNEKQDIAELSDAEQRVAVAAKGLLRKFRWKSSVDEKGDEARTHFGIIAQDLQAAFAAEGLDAGDYAMFINSTWTDEETGEERSRMGVRYSELLAFIIAAI